MADYQDSTNDDFNLDDETEALDELDVDDDVDDEFADEFGGVEGSAQVKRNFKTKQEVSKAVYQQVYKTTNTITKYEKARIIGTRAQEIADGAPTFVDPGDLTDPIEIARLEYQMKKIPILIGRPLPSKNRKKPVIEYRRVNDLQQR